MSKARAARIWWILSYIVLLSAPAMADWGDYLATNGVTEVLEGPDNGFPARTTLEAGRLVVELDRLRGFVQIRIPAKSHLTGWVRGDSLSLVRRWADAAGYPEGHPAAAGTHWDRVSDESQAASSQSNAVVWGLLVAATVVAVVLFWVWRNRSDRPRGDAEATRLWTPMRSRVRGFLYRHICGQGVGTAADNSDPRGFVTAMPDPEREIAGNDGLAADRAILTLWCPHCGQTNQLGMSVSQSLPRQTTCRHCGARFSVPVSRIEAVESDRTEDL